MRRPRKAPVRKEEGPRVNEAIKAREIQLIDQDGDNQGSMPLADALARAADAGMDLVEISPHADPPVCKILDYGKFKYLAQKKANEARKKQKTIDIKEIKMRPGIDTHDYEVKMKALERFIGQGDKVKVTLRFKGREVAHKELGRSLLEKVRDQAGDYTKVELEPKMEGRQMMMVLAPK